MNELQYDLFDEELCEDLLWDEPGEEETECQFDREETDLYGFIETLHFHLMGGNPLTNRQWEELGQLLLKQTMTSAEIGRANSVGEPPDSILGMAAAKLMNKLPEKIGPAPLENGHLGWLNRPVPIGPPRATATNSRHIRNYFHACIGSILKDEYDKKQKFLGLPDSRQSKRLGLPEKADPVPGSTWSVGGDSIRPLEAISDASPSPEDILCSEGCSDAFRALAALNHKAEFILFYLYRKLGFPPREQIVLFSAISPETALSRADRLLRRVCPSLHPNWTLPLKSRLNARWNVPLTTDTISTGISRVKKSLEKQQLRWNTVA